MATQQKKVSSRIIPKHDIESNWNKATNFIPLKGEIIVYDADENYSYPRIKHGDGVTNVNELPFRELQVDWNQTDNTQVDYIKNKPFYEEIIDTTHFFVEDKEVEVDPQYGSGNMHWDGAKFTKLTVGELYDVKFKLTKADGSYREVIYTGIECVDTAQWNEVEGGTCPSLMSFPEGLPTNYYPPAINYHSNTDNLYFMLVNNVGGVGPFSYDDTKCQYCVEVYTELPSAESSGTIDSELTIHFSVYQGGRAEIGRSDKYLNVLQSDFELSDDTTTNYIRNKPFDIKETVSSKTIELVYSEAPISVQGQLGLEQGQKVHFKHGNYEFDASVGSFDIFHNAIQVSDDVNGIQLTLIDGQAENGNDFDGYIYSCVTTDNQPVTAELTTITKEPVFNTKYKDIFQADFNEIDKNKPNFIKNKPLSKTTKTFEGIDDHSQFDLGVTYYGYIKKNSSAQVTYSPNFYTDNICLYHSDNIYPCFQGNSFTDTDSLWMSVYNNDFTVKLKQDNISLDFSLVKAGCIQYVALLEDEYNASRYVRVVNHCKMEADETSPIEQFRSCRLQRAKLSYAENSSVIYFTTTLTEDLFGNTFSICNNEPFNYKVNHKAEIINIRDYEEYLNNNSNGIDEITNAIVDNNFIIMPHSNDSTEVICLKSDGKYQSTGLYSWDYNFNIAPEFQLNKPSILNNFIQKVQDIINNGTIVQRYTTSKFIPANLDDIKITAYYNGNSYECSPTIEISNDPSEKTLTATVTIPLNADDIIRYYSYDTNETIATTAGEAGISEFTSMLQILQHDDHVFGMYDKHIVNGSYIRYSLDGVSYSIEPATNEYIVTNKLDGSYLPQVRVAKVDPILRSFSDSNENTTISTDTGKLNDLIDTSISNNSTINGLLNNTAPKLSNFKNIATMNSLMLDEYNTLYYHNSYKDSNDYQIMEVAASLDSSSRIATHVSEDALFSFDFNTKKCMFKYKFNNGDIAENTITFNKDTDKEIYKQIVQNNLIMNTNYNCYKIYRIANSYDYQYIQYVIDFDANTQTQDINKCLLITKMDRTDATSDCLGAFIDKTKFNSLTKVESDTGTTVLADGTKIIRYNSYGIITETDWGVEISTNDYTTKALIGVNYSAQHNSRDQNNFAIVKLNSDNNKIKFIYNSSPTSSPANIITFEINMPEPITYNNWKLLWLRDPTKSQGYYNLYLMTDSKLYKLSNNFNSSLSVVNTYTLPTNFGAGKDKSNPIMVNGKINILSMDYSNAKYTLRIASLVAIGNAEFVTKEIEQIDSDAFLNASSRFRYLKDFNSNTITTNDKVCTIILQPKDGIGSFISTANKPYKIGIIPNKYTQDEYITKLEERITKLETEIISGLDEVLADIGGR